MSKFSPAEIAFFSKNSLDLDAFSGKWFIVHTNLGYWKDKSNPAVVYNPLGAGKMRDELQYLDRRGLAQKLVGMDRLIDQGGSSFHWVAQPWYLSFVNSAWGVIDHDQAYAQWAVTYFSQTIFTPAGMDIYSRTPSLDNKLYRSILEKVSRVQFLEEHIAGLHTTNRSDTTS